MKLLVLGATGATGREIVRQAILAGHEVIAAARRPESAALSPGARVVRADVTDAASLAAAAEGCDAVASALGTKLSRKPTTLLSSGTRALVAAMNQHRVRRLVCITGIGAGDSRGHGGFFYNRVIQPLLLAEIYKDKDRQEEVVRASGLDWTIVRPATLSGGPARGGYRVLTDLRGVQARTIPRADVAGYVVSILAAPATHGQAVVLTR